MAGGYPRDQPSYDRPTLHYLSPPCLTWGPEWRSSPPLRLGATNPLAIVQADEKRDALLLVVGRITRNDPERNTFHSNIGHDEQTPASTWTRSTLASMMRLTSKETLLASWTPYAEDDYVVTQRTNINVSNKVCLLDHGNIHSEGQEVTIRRAILPPNLRPFALKLAILIDMIDSLY